IVALGTSAPELVVNIIASVQEHPDIVLGNIIGSNNFNLFIILGLSGLILPITIQSSTAWKQIPISLLATVILLLLLNDYTFPEQRFTSRVDGVIMLSLFLLFLYYAYIQMKKDREIPTAIPTIPTASPTRIWGLIIAGIAGLVIGGRLVVNNSISIAESLGVSEKIIGLTIVAAGTSLPELVTSVVAAFKKNSDIAVGNVIGSNIFNILLVFAISTLINPGAYNPKFNTEIFILIGGTSFLLLFMLSGHRKKLDRWEAGLLFGFYALYMTYLVMQEL
ncbi:MAG: calcium/sodium antiporter, partial [Bacteroidales bacterium]